MAAMQTFSEKIEGPFTLDSDLTLRGMIEGDATVPSGRTLVLHGMVSGDLHVEPEGSAIVNGVVGGSVRNRGRVEVAGCITGELEGHRSGLQHVGRGCCDREPRRGSVRKPLTGLPEP